jgi:hypothetical protein
MEEIIFEKICHKEQDGREYWLARELASATGYKDYRNFKSVVVKAISLCRNNNAKETDHFVECTEMVEVGSGAKRELASYRLTRYACLLVAMCMNAKKVQAIEALQYFSGKQKITKGVDLYKNTDLVFFSDPEGNLRVQLFFDGDTVWTTQKRIAEIFQVEVNTVSYHIGEIFATGELNKYSVVRKDWITAADGKKYETNLYNLDVIIAVGYRVNSYKATRFRQWATNTLSLYIKNGYVLDDDRFKYGNQLTDVKFEQLLERIREIRASERMAYQKITDIYATACDYQKDANETREFYAKVQNKLHWAIAGQTAAEIIYFNADASKLNMGLSTWAQAPDGKILKSDVAIAKNYLSEEHMRELNRIVEAYINLAETRAKNHRPTTMQQWAEFLDNFLTLASYPILMDKGKISALQAKLKAYEEYDKYRVIQDRLYMSDFDKEVKRLKDEMGLPDGKSK